MRMIGKEAMQMMFESKCRRRTRGRIEDLTDEMGRMLTYDEIKVEFSKRGFPRPFKKIVVNILEKMKHEQTANP